MGKKLQGWFGGGLLALLLLAPTLARADFLEDAGMGTATVLANVLYMPPSWYTPLSEALPVASPMF